MKILGKIIILLGLTPLFAFAEAKLEIICPPASACPKTLDATDRSDTSARLSGQFNITSGKATVGYFRYTNVFPPPVFCKEIYGSDMLATSEVALGTSDAKQWNQVVLGLLPETTYSFCAIASDNGVIHYGNVETFKTLPAGCTDGNDCPFVSVATEPAFAITNTTAYLTGSFQNTVPSKVWFEYSTDIGLGNAKETTKKSLNTNSSGQYKPQITGLEPGQTYYFRMIGEENDTKKQAIGGTLSFKTTGISVGPVGPPDGPIGPIPVGPIALPTPISDAIVRKGEGVEHVFYRQARTSDPVLQLFGFDQSQERESFSKRAAHAIAKVFGYVDPARKEVRVVPPDIAAYVLRLFNNTLFVDEYLFGKLLGTRSPQVELKPLRAFEYLFQK